MIKLITFELMCEGNSIKFLLNALNIFIQNKRIINYFL